jgi:hypothetical protein
MNSNILNVLNFNKKAPIYLKIRALSPTIPTK